MYMYVLAFVVCIFYCCVLWLLLPGYNWRSSTCCLAVGSHLLALISASMNSVSSFMTKLILWCRTLQEHQPESTFSTAKSGHLSCPLLRSVLKSLFQPFVVYLTKALLQIHFRSLWWSWRLRRLRHFWLNHSTTQCLLVTSQWHLRKHSSHRLLRSLVLMLRMFGHTAQSPIYRWCRSYLSRSWHSNSTVT